MISENDLMNAIADALRAQSVAPVRVEPTGGGCLTVYAGPSMLPIAIGGDMIGLDDPEAWPATLPADADADTVARRVAAILAEAYQPVSDDVADALSSVTPADAGGDADEQGGAAYAYTLAAPVDVYGYTVPAGNYLRLISDKAVTAYRMPAASNVLAYVANVEQAMRDRQHAADQHARTLDMHGGPCPHGGCPDCDL